MLHRHLYVSSLRTTLVADAWASRLADWRWRNQARAITSVLLESQGSLMQLLEGPQAAVAALFDRIVQDPRHTGLIVMVSEPATRRLLSGHPLAFCNRGPQAPADDIPFEGVRPRDPGADKPAAALAAADVALCEVLASFGRRRQVW